MDQATYDAYGNTTDSVPAYAPAIEFTGRENDGTDGLYYMRSRYYAPSIGRFISRDTAGIAGGLNMYAYAGDSPTNATDPMGQDGEDVPPPAPDPYGGYYNPYDPEGLGAPGVYVGAGLGPLRNQGGLDHDVLPRYPGQNGGGLQLAGDPIKLIPMEGAGEYIGSGAGDATVESITPETLPEDLDVTLGRIGSAESFPHRNDGSVFGNKEGLLPPKPPGYYTEYVHPTPGVNGPGARRIVTGKGGEVYYSPDHYKTFIRVK